MSVGQPRNHGAPAQIDEARAPSGELQDLASAADREETAVPDREGFDDLRRTVMVPAVRGPVRSHGDDLAVREHGIGFGPVTSGTPARFATTSVVVTIPPVVAEAGGGENE